MEVMLKYRGESIEGKTDVVSGAGNLTQYAVEKLIELGAKPVTMSYLSGFVFDPAGNDSYLWGANVPGSIKAADAMLASGLIRSPCMCSPALASDA